MVNLYELWDGFEEYLKNFNGIGIDLKLAGNRMEICLICERYDSKLKQCKECSCFMPAKTILIAMKCPLDKW